MKNVINKNWNKMITPTHLRFWLWLRRLFKIDKLHVGVDFAEQGSDKSKYYIVVQQYKGINYIIFQDEN